MNVLVIPEDFRKDQYILKPIVEQLAREVGWTKARVIVCQDPLLGGIGEALKWDRIAEILNRYRSMVDLFLLLVDRDQVEGRRMQLDRLEEQARQYLSGSAFFFAENAYEELEVWVLAGHDLGTSIRWQDVRAERDPKEQYFEPLAKRRNLLGEPGQGRKTLSKEAAGRYSRIRQLCPELASLEARVRNASVTIQ